MKNTLGDRAFTVAAPSLWKKLPSAVLRDEDNFERPNGRHFYLRYLVRNSFLYFFRKATIVNNYF